MTRYYCETLSPLGEWCPQIWDRDPNTRLNKTLQVRAVSKIEPDHERLTLAQLREVYSPDGKLRHTRSASNEDAVFKSVRVPT